MLGSLELKLTASIGGVLISDPFLTLRWTPFLNQKELKISYGEKGIG